MNIGDSEARNCGFSIRESLSHLAMEVFHRSLEFLHDYSIYIAYLISLRHPDNALTYQRDLHIFNP